MPLPEYIPSDLPQYASSVDRTSFNSAVVQSGDALMFIESGKLIVKKDDGNFYEIGEGSGGTDVSDTTATPADVLVTAAFYDSTGTRQSGTIPTVSAGISGSAVVVPSGYIAAAQTFPVSGGVDVSSTTAEAGGVLSGLVFYDSTGNQTTGTIPTVSAAVSGSNVVVPVGYIGTSQTFPVTGGGIDLSSTTAVASGVLSGLVFYDSDGDKTTGTIPTVSPFVSGSNVVVIPSGYLPVSLAVPLSGGVDVSSTTITSDMVLSGGIFYDSDGVQRSGTIPTVSAIRSDSEIIVPRGYISSPQQFNVSGGVDVSDTTAEDYMVMSGALFYDSDGNLTTGTIPYVSAPEDMITPTTSYQTISGGGYLDMDIVIEGDPYLVPQNIRAGVWIFGVEGTYGDFSDVTVDPEDVLEDEVFYDSDGNLRSGTIPYAVVPAYWITPTTTSQQIGSGYLDDNVIVAGDSNLVASNIRSGVTIFDVEGEYEGSGGVDFSAVTADPEDVLEDEVFYDSDGNLQFGMMRAEYDIEPIMPSTSSQVVSGDCYLGADLVISGDSNLVASNIRSGVTIFEVAGAYEGSGGSGGIDVSSTTAVASDVLSGKVFYDSNGTLTSGTLTMPNVAAGYVTVSSGVVTLHDLTNNTTSTVDKLYIADTGVSEPAYEGSSVGSSTNFYKCASVGSGTWTGYLASVDPVTGVWSFAETATTGLTYGFYPVPQVGKVYVGENCISEIRVNIPQTGLLFYMPLVSSASTTQTGQTITTIGNPVFESVSGISCCTFSGSDYFSVAMPSTIQSGADWTYSSYMRINKDNITTSTTNFCAFSSGEDSDQNMIRIHSYNAQNQGKKVFCDNLNNPEIGVYGDYTSNKWFHVCITYSDGTLTMFINNSQTRQVSMICYFNNIFYVGTRLALNNNFIGNMAALRIYNRVLTSEEISALASEFTPTVS